MDVIVIVNDVKTAIPDSLELESEANLGWA